MENIRATDVEHISREEIFLVRILFSPAYARGVQLLDQVQSSLLVFVLPVDLCFKSGVAVAHRISVRAPPSPMPSKLHKYYCEGPSFFNLVIETYH
jgi:hypothetical protein